MENGALNHNVNYKYVISKIKKKEGREEERKGKRKKETNSIFRVVYMKCY